MSPYESIFEEDYFANGLAVCEAHILTDTYYCRFRDEQYEFPTVVMRGVVKYDPSRFNTAPVEKLRALKEEEAKANG